MSLPIFHALDTTDWTRVSLIVAFVTAFWVGLVSILPAKYYTVGSVILGSLQSAITLMMRSGKSRVEIIGDKIEEHREDKAKKEGEIEHLIVSEIKEREVKND